MYISPFDVPPILPSTEEPNLPVTQHQNDPPPSIMIQANGDILSELLIAQLLEEDLRMLAQAQEAERVQLDHVLTESKLAARLALDPKGKRAMSPFVSLPEEEIDSDAKIALQIAVNEARAESDAAYAQSLQSSQNSAILADQQAAQKWAAAERKLMLDAEFAKQLQAMQNQGKDIDSDPSARDVETVLGRARVDDILARDPNSEDKGKGKAAPQSNGRDIIEDVEVETEDNSSRISPYQKCGICLEPFQITHSPISAVQSANSSARLPFGLQLPCPNSHPYCLECVGSYIRSKIDPHDNGKGNFGSVVFPINCPECEEGEWVDGIPDDVASRVVDGAMMNLWHHQKLLDSAPRYYCPNPKCSVIVQLPEDPDVPQAACPACNVALCIPCRVLWHDNLSCEEYQELPLDERSPDDQLALQLMKAQHWRRCPNCAFIIELTQGCFHVTCTCGTQFCFKCGALWDKKKGGCTRNPSCDLWDEELLYEEQERRRRNNMEPPPAAPVPMIHLDLEHEVALSRFNWMMNGGIRVGRHYFTRDMIQTLTCQYCHQRANSLADLRYHLSTTTTHSVFSCCGKFFRREADYDRHINSLKGWHENEVSRIN